MRAYKLVSLAGALAGILALSACDVSVPSQVLATKMRLEERMVARSVDARHVQPGQVMKLADHFIQAGKGDMVLTLSYLTGDQAGRARVEKLGNAYRKAFSQKGVPRLSVVAVPVGSRMDAEKAVVTYNSLAALPAKGCGSVPGHDGTTGLDDVDEYSLGCGTQTAISKMIADPSDLEGKSGTQGRDSRRSGTIIEPYKAGVPNQRIQGYSASGIGG